MIEFPVGEGLRTLPRRGSPTGGLAPVPPSTPAPVREPPSNPGSAGESDGGTVEISVLGRRLQVEAQVRNAVLAELRLLAQAARQGPTR